MNKLNVKTNNSPEMHARMQAVISSVTTPFIAAITVIKLISTGVPDAIIVDYGIHTACQSFFRPSWHNFKLLT